MKVKARQGDRDSIETELKMGVRRSNAARMAEAVMKLPSASRTQVRSLYFDTSKDSLALGGVSLRLREQSGRWMQTLKWRQGVGNQARLEHEVEVVTTSGNMPVVQLHLHQGTVAGDHASELLCADSDESPLILRYESLVQRAAARIRQGSSEIEVAYDLGHVHAEGHALQISELELELKKGGIVDLIDSATNWSNEHGLWLLHESKADRGLRLLTGERLAPMTKATMLAVSHPEDLAHLSAAVLGNCLEQVLPNAAAIAEGSGHMDYVHQLRVGLRRLRTALRELGFGRCVVAAIDPSVTKVFRELGNHRDQQHVHEAIEQQVLRETGATAAAWASPHARLVDLRALVREREFQGALLAVMRLKESVTKRGEHRKVRSKRWLRPRLERLSRRVAVCGKRFQELSSEKQHEVRKRLKRLRYLSEFAAPLFPAKRVERYLRALKPAQDALGSHNDLAVARSMAASGRHPDPDALMAVAWFDRAQEETAREAAKRLRKARAAPPFW